MVEGNDLKPLHTIFDDAFIKAIWPPNVVHIYCSLMSLHFFPTYVNYNNIMADIPLLESTPLLINFITQTPGQWDSDR